MPHKVSIHNINLAGIWIGIREVTLFALGVLLVFHSVFGNGAIDRVIELTVGLILVGIVPMDVVVAKFLNGRYKKETND